LAKKKKYYVVWEGHKPGVYDSWTECQRQVSGYKNANFKSFESKEQAIKAFENPESVVEEPNGKTLYYVVWRGKKPGIYRSWRETQAQIQGAIKPKFKSFGSKDLAEKAFEEGPENYEGRSFKKARDLSPEEKEKIGDPILLSLSVDAACNAKTGEFEYQGVITESGTQVFHVGPYQDGTNNIGEFLALVHALAWLKKNRSDLPIYSDSKYAMAWVRKKKANSKVRNAKTLSLLSRAEKWLNENEWPNEILKWETKAWGDIPADFNRK